MVHIHNEILLSHRSKEIVSIVEMWMDLKTVIPVKLSHDKYFNQRNLIPVNE